MKKADKNQLLHSKNILQLQNNLSDNLWLVHIVDFCKLKMVDNCRSWVDDQGNELHINRKNEGVIKPADVQSLDTSQDLYYGGSPKWVLEKSNCFALIDDILFFLGKDLRLRSYFCSDDEVTRINPLELDIDILREVIYLLFGLEIMNAVFDNLPFEKNDTITKLKQRNIPVINKLFGVK